MDVVGSEIGQKMRSAIKAKLTELGCYVDDELPDYVMVMVANKRTRIQMEDDLQLFLGDNTVLFVNWLHQVLKKLQEVTVAAPAKHEGAKSKERSKSKEQKPKEKRHKDKKKKKSDSAKKAKKKSKDKSHRKKEHRAKNKKEKNKTEGILRPNIPPLLMNIEKQSEPSITDVFAGQILKNHGIVIDDVEEKVIKDIKPVVAEIKKPIVPIIDPATIATELIEDKESDRNSKEAQLLEIEAKIQGLKQKLSEQLTDSMSEDDDFLNIRTEAEELLNDFSDDVLQETTAPVTNTPPVTKILKDTKSDKVETKDIHPISEETLPLIELNLPKRPVRERLGEKLVPNKNPIESINEVPTQCESQKRYTPEIEQRPETKSAKSRLGEPPEKINKDISSNDSSEKEKSSKKVDTKAGEPRTCASVVRVRPRPRVAAPASSLLLRAVADAHKSLLNIPPKVEVESTTVKRALVLPMRRCVDPQKIVIEVPCNDRLEDNKNTDNTQSVITKKIVNDTYFPPRRLEDRIGAKRVSPPVLETLNIHNTTVDKQKDTQFIVTMDGYHPNAFLAKKLITEGLFDDDVEMKELSPLKPPQEKPKTGDVLDTEAKKEDKPSSNEEDAPSACDALEEKLEDKVQTDEKAEKLRDKAENGEEQKSLNKRPKAETNLGAITKKRLSDTSDESDTQVIINKGDELKKNEPLNNPPVKKRKASPIVFDIDKKDKCERDRKSSVNSDSNVTVITTGSNHKYDNVKPLSESARTPCASFPACRWGAACAYAHPPCRFGAACSRRGCVYSHAAHVPTVASHVIPSANYKSVAGSIPNLCKYYPSCSNPLCRYQHPRACRYGAACLNKLVCNFYHAEVAAAWRKAP